MGKFADRVLETSTSTGTGNFTTAGAVTGYQTFNNGVGLNIEFDYAIIAVDGSGVPTGQWETGSGYMSTSTTLVRDAPGAGSATVPVNFSAGTKQVFLTQRALQATSRAKMLAHAMNIGWV